MKKTNPELKAAQAAMKERLSRGKTGTEKRTNAKLEAKQAAMKGRWTKEGMFAERLRAIEASKQPLGTHVIHSLLGDIKVEATIKGLDGEASVIVEGSNQFGKTRVLFSYDRSEKQLRVRYASSEGSGAQAEGGWAEPRHRNMLGGILADVITEWAHHNLKIDDAALQRLAEWTEPTHSKDEHVIETLIGPIRIRIGPGTRSAMCFNVDAEFEFRFNGCILRGDFTASWGADEDAFGVKYEGSIERRRRDTRLKLQRNEYYDYVDQRLLGEFIEGALARWIEGDGKEEFCKHRDLLKGYLEDRTIWMHH